VIGVHGHGIAGAGAAQAIVVVGLMLPLYLYFLSRAGVRPAAVIGALAPAAAWGGVAAGVAWRVSRQFSDPLLACVVGAVAGVALYVIPHAGTLLIAVRDARARRTNRNHQPDDLTDLTDRTDLTEADIATGSASPGNGVPIIKLATQRERL